MRYDAIVLGLGGMGSAVAAHAAARGLRVLGIDRFGPAHALGSSHGETRMIRQAYFESPAYVPLLRRTYALWDALEARTGSVLRARTGGIFAGRPETPVVAGALASARQWELPHALYDAGELRRRFPMLRPRADEVGVYEAVAGAVFPEAAIRTHLRLAAEDGAELRFETQAAGWDAGERGVRVTLASGEAVEAERLALCSGAWFARLAPDLGLPLRVERNVQFWFAPRDRAAVGPGVLPVYGLERDGARMLYGFPDLGQGVKAGVHGSGIEADPDALDRTVSAAEAERMRAALADFIPAAAGAFVRAAVCMYTLTPDENFVIGLHPRAPRVVVAGGFSGHGFKFAPAVGEIVGALLADADPGFDLSLFAPDRFARAAP